MKADVCLVNPWHKSKSLQVVNRKNMIDFKWMIDFDELAVIIVFKMVISNDKWSSKVLVILILVQNIIQNPNSTITQWLVDYI